MALIYDGDWVTFTQGLYNNKKSNYAAEDVYYGPSNAKNDPCGTCPKIDACAVALTDCKALRYWQNKGTYINEDVQVNIKRTAKGL